MTDKKTPLAGEPEKKSATKAPASKEPTAKASAPVTKAPASKAPKAEASEPITKAPVSNVSDTKEKPANVPPKEAESSGKNKVSKLAIVAIIIAIVITIIHYFWQQQQSLLLTIKLSEQIEKKNTATFNQYQAQVKQALTAQQRTFAQQLQLVKNQVNNSSQEKIAKLNTTVNQLEHIVRERQPSDWLLHEAEYLIRIAARTVWLENDTTAAIGLLKDADARLADVHDPALLPVRELVHQDIKALELMPTLQTDEVVLTLMAMNKQVAILPLAMVDVGPNKKANHELSNDINDWKANLTKTWEKFIDDFIRVRQTTGLIEPLISPEQQQHLRQNLNLKVQLALWAATERKGDVYKQALTDIQLWINEFFDLKDASNQHFLTSLTNLQTKRVSYNYPSGLKSLKSIRTTLRNKPTIPAKSYPLPKAKQSVKKIAAPIKKSTPVKVEPKKAVPVSETTQEVKKTPIAPAKQSDVVEAVLEKTVPASKVKTEAKIPPATPAKQSDAVKAELEKATQEVKKTPTTPVKQPEAKTTPEKQSDAVKAETDKSSPSTKQQDDKPSNEEII
jgi:uroporphyrin-3 C-methyltransferase